ncbi:MAG: hypothetical protein ACK6EB_35935, partial [Planctomyces sp.]
DSGGHECAVQRVPLKKFRNCQPRRLPPQPFNALTTLPVIWMTALSFTPSSRLMKTQSATE